MVDRVSDDNGFDAPSPRLETDPHGRAAMLLVESLIHGLIARSVLTVAQAVEIIEIAAESGANIAEENGVLPGTDSRTVVLLDQISASLQPDILTE